MTTHFVYFFVKFFQVLHCSKNKHTKCFFCSGPPSNARCSFSCECNAILCQCAANHKVRLSCYFTYLLLYQNTRRRHIFANISYLFSFTCQIAISRGRNVYVQFSSHQELTIMEQNTQGRGDEVCLFFQIISILCSQSLLKNLVSIMCLHCSFSLSSYL